MHVNNRCLPRSLPHKLSSSSSSRPHNYCSLHTGIILHLRFLYNIRAIIVIHVSICFVLFCIVYYLLPSIYFCFFNKKSFLQLPHHQIVLFLLSHFDFWTQVNVLPANSAIWLFPTIQSKWILISSKSNPIHGLMISNGVIFLPSMLDLLHLFFPPQNILFLICEFRGWFVIGRS